MKKLRRLMMLGLGLAMFSTPPGVDWESFIAGPGCKPGGLGGSKCVCCDRWLGGVMILQPGGGYAWK